RSDADRTCDFLRSDTILNLCLITTSTVKNLPAGALQNAIVDGPGIELNL
ncbi:hypothetical protein L195_g037317, partial [Trifolium pratense]